MSAHDHPTTTQPPNSPTHPPPASSESESPTGLYDLPSKWPLAADLHGSSAPCRVEGAIRALPTFGHIPPQVVGTFYRVTCDPFLPPHPGNLPLDGDGSVQALRLSVFQPAGGAMKKPKEPQDQNADRGEGEGEVTVDMHIRYVETERLLLERKAGRALFGLYRNPFTHHPCVRSAVDSTANTNVVFWAGRLLALKEGGLPYAVDPSTLATLGYDPFPGQIRAKTFTAHPKADPFRRELVVFGYEATGLGSRDVVLYALDERGKVVDRTEQWLRLPWPALVHDMAVTERVVVLVLWPFEASVERMKRGGQHWAWRYDLAATFVVVPRRPDAHELLPPGWKPGEHRVYEWRNCMPIHTAGAWEEEAQSSSSSSSSDGGSTTTRTMIYLESSRVHDNAFPFFPADDGTLPAADARADYVRWALDLGQPSGATIADPDVVLDVPSEFPRIDERFLSRRFDVVFLCVFVPDTADGKDKNLFHGLNALAMHRHSTNTTEYFYAGDESLVQEPVFVPRDEGAAEGDGWVMTMVERVGANRNDLVVLDTRDFGSPVAVVRLPFGTKAQVHGNWVEEARLREAGLVFELGEMVEGLGLGKERRVSGRGALEPL